MKIALVIERFDPQHGGAEHWTYQHAMELVGRGHEVHVVCERLGASIADGPLLCHTFPRQRTKLARAAAAETTLRKHRFDVIHDIGLGWHCDVLQSEDGSRLAQWESKLRMLPSALRPCKRAMIRVLPRYRQFRTLMERQFDAPHRMVLAVSQMCADDYQRFHGVPAERIRVVYHGTDTARFSLARRQHFRQPIRERLGIAGDEVVFLFVGHDFARKGLATAVRAVRRLADQDLPVRLLVVGQRKASRAADRVSDDRRVIAFAGRVTDAAPYYAAADALVLPTFYDPCSLTVGEAAASGLPVVTTRANGASELLTEGHDGFLLDDPNDDAALSERLQRLLDPQRRRLMGIAARQMALRFPLRRNCDEIIDVYQAAREWKRRIRPSPSADVGRPDTFRPAVTARGTLAQK